MGHFVSVDDHGSRERLGINKGRGGAACHSFILDSFSRVVGLLGIAVLLSRYPSNENVDVVFT